MRYQVHWKQVTGGGSEMIQLDQQNHRNLHLLFTFLSLDVSAHNPVLNIYKDIWSQLAISLYQFIKKIKYFCTYKENTASWQNLGLQ